MNINYELLQYFVYKRLIKKKEVAKILKACEEKGSSLTNYLSEQNICPEQKSVRALGDFYAMPDIEMSLLSIDQELFDKFSYKLMKKYNVVPVCFTEDGLLLATIVNPTDLVAKSVLSSVFNCKVDYILVSRAEMNSYLDTIQAVNSTSVALDELKKQQEAFDENAEFDEDAQDDVINAPAVRLVDSIIKEAIPYRASDIHIEPYEKVVKVRYRIDGDLIERFEFDIENFAAVNARFKIMSGINIAERRIPQDGRINMIIGGLEYDFRVSTLPTVYGEKFVLRILDKSSFNFTRNELGFTESENVIIDKILAHPHGIVLLTGPTGCGKSTTLYSFLKELNKPNVNIITVEDPVEYTMYGINQTQVNVKANMTFATALRSILRQDPDIIMIGEIRDEETAQIAIRSAITGHLVFSTLHTNDAPGSITRLMDMGISSYLVADAFVGVIAQRLVKKLCPICKKKYKTKPEEMEFLGITEPAHIYKAQGCPYCNQTGYKGRVAIHEVMYLNDKIRGAITTNVSIDELRKVAKEQGMVTLLETCKSYVLSGVTSISEMLAIYSD